MTKPLTPEQLALVAAFNAAKATFEANRTPENLAAVKAADAAKNASFPPVKPRGRGCRAGRLQYAILNEGRRR